MLCQESSFVLDSIERAIEEDDEEALDKFIQYKFSKFDVLTTQQMDLIQFGGFSYQDTQMLKVVEKNRFIDILTKRLEKKPQ